MEILLITYVTLFALICWYRLEYGFFLFFLLLPTYLIRFHLGFLPMTLLETKLFVLSLFVLLQWKKIHPQKTIVILWKSHKNFVIATALFILSASLSLFHNEHLRSAAGEWKAFYLEPILFSFIFISYFFSLENKKLRLIQNVLIPLILSGFVTTLLCIYQHFTGWMVPWDFWENRATFRVTGWYGFPNAVGLYLAPLYPLGIYIFYEAFQMWKKQNKISFTFILSFLFLLLSPFALFFAKGSGPIIGVLAGIVFLLLSFQRTRIYTVLLGGLCILGFIILPSTNVLKQEILMQNRSGQIRFQMWGETIEYLLHHPIAGTGLASYQTKLWPYRYDKWIEIFHHPHNIFLTMWVNLGFLGLFTFLWILVDFFFRGICMLKNRNTSQVFLLSIFSTLIVFLVCGLVDSPYIKNDLSILFWTLLALPIILTQDSLYAKKCSPRGLEDKKSNHTKRDAKNTSQTI
ncbi:MAG: hypothetical protein COV59_00130 [Candidatus Magasanikbacteria bacterium CG11_big_fil_rev_8_21_14_0_20_39_34]|uniref:O-antigen ligase-related domain-containing protein n=1 Tax=Candidatus Magasanikbacteria bacterium CG11_big_fil_rev_8_21_14_0_20_39_34 TaxID=1974653 RepID=A0A2H0N6K3_9BACT|nr:MAG: hypothetical protein COV59_00130 [Candidatus Magasanikbacteria bacterium CG11_big_fil_rev_8_21_14_0_20_39_34]